MIGYKQSSGGWSSRVTYPLRPYGIILLIIAIFEGIIGHFLVNVCLAIPFILLNNGDILESMISESSSIADKKKSNANSLCKRCGKLVGIGYTSCPHCGSDDFE